MINSNHKWDKIGLIYSLDSSTKNKFLLKESIKKLIQNPKLGIQYGLKARERVKDKFELSFINNNILEIYKKILTNS